MADPRNDGRRDDDGYLYLKDLLDDYGLGTLADWAWDMISGGRSSNYIIQELRERPEYKVRFKGNEERVKRGLGRLSEAEYIAYEKGAAEMLKRAGMPQGFYDQPEDFTNLISGGVSLSELASRVEEGYVAVMNADPTVRAELQRQYGVSEAQMAAFFLDPERALPLLQRQVATAFVGSAAQRTGYGPLGRDEAEGLVRSGVDSNRAEQGFSKLAAMSELFNPLDSGEDAIGREEQLGAEFRGNAHAQRRVEERARRRRSAFEGGGGFANDREGFGGIGSAR